MRHGLWKKLRPPSFRLRGLIVAVALVSIPLAIWARIEARRTYFLRVAAYHRSRVICIVCLPNTPGGVRVINMTRDWVRVGPERVDLDLWRLVMAKKYEEAAARPWMPVGPDPPPPAVPDGQ